MQTPPPILVIALVAAISGLVFLGSTFNGNINNNWLIKSISTPVNLPELLPVANALGKDLMLDVAPQLHPSLIVGESADALNFQHWIDQDIHCEDCLRLEIPNSGKNVGVAFSNQVGYNFEGAKKITFYAMAEEDGAKVHFKAVGNDIDNNTTTSVPADDVFKNQEFALTSQNVTLNQTWGYFEMSLDGLQEELINVKYPFAFVVAPGSGDPAILYMKGITYSAEPVLDQYLLQASSSSLTATTMATTANTTTTLNVALSDNATETVNAPATVEFNATVADGEGPYSFNWDFGDGIRDTRTDGNKIHTFDTAGLYNVTVDAIDSLNSTGSASTLVNVTEQIANGEPAKTSTENVTPDSQTTDRLNTTNTNTTTTAAAAPPVATDNSNNNTETKTSDSGESNASNNSPPIANAGNDLTGTPNERVTLDASKSTDPDEGDAIVSYQWEQESGPTAAIDDKNSQTPIVTLPDIDNDATIVFSLTVNDGKADSEERDTVSIHVDNIDELTGNVQTRILKPDGVQTSEWIVASDCSEQGRVECLSDGSDATFVTAGLENVDALNLYSFGEFSEDGAVVDPNSLVIERVAVEITAKKLGNTGYISFAVDDPSKEGHYFTPSISIASNSFQKYDQVWDTSPVTGKQWTYDSLNSLIAGFKYDGGQSGVQISEIQLTVSYYLPQPVPEPAPSDDLKTAEHNNDSGANENDENGDIGANGAQDTNQVESGDEEPAIETNSTNSNTADSNDAADEDSSG